MMLGMVHHLWETVGIAGFAALWAVKALCGVALLRAIRPIRVRLGLWWRGGGQGI